jgi:hypothetical protein
MAIAKERKVTQIHNRHDKMLIVEVVVGIRWESVVGDDCCETEAMRFGSMLSEVHIP